MANQHMIFEGGSKDGATGLWPDDGTNIGFDPAFEQHELYERTAEVRVIDGVERVVFRLIDSRPPST